MRQIYQMHNPQKEVKKKFKLVNPKCKSQKNYQTITRCQAKEIPKVKRKSVSLYKIDYTKEYSLPLGNTEDLKFQFWGCAHPPKKIKVRNPFLSENKSKDRLLTGQSKNLLKHYLVRKVALGRNAMAIKAQQKSLKDFCSLQTRKRQIQSAKESQMKNVRTCQISPYKPEAFDTRFFMSTMISDCEDSIALTPSQKFRPLKETIFMQKLHEIKERISQKNNLLGQIKSNMNMIRFKKMNLSEFE